MRLELLREDKFIVIQFRFIMKYIGGTAEAAEIVAPGIREPGRNDGLRLYASQLGIPFYLLFNYEIATRGCGQLL